MGFPMTVERVISRNRLDEPNIYGKVNTNLLDDIRRLAEDSAILAVRALNTEDDPTVDHIPATEDQ